MALVNEHFLKLPGSYLFSDIAKKVNTFRITHPKQEVIRLGIGDVTRPLPPVCIEAMHKAVEEMADARTFRGYGPEQGYDFLIEAIIKHDYLPRGIHFGPTEIFVNDGAKSDTGNIGDILRHAGRRTHPAEQALEPPPIYQVQRYQLHHPAGGGSHLHTGGTAADKGNDRLLYGQCPDHEAGP